MIKLFIGYDPRETVAYYVMSHSIITRASQPISIAPLSLKNREPEKEQYLTQILPHKLV